MKLIHYSLEPLTEIRPAEQGPPHFKPKGLWVSAGAAWKQWCKSSNFDLHRLKHQTVIRLVRKANVLRLSTAEELIAFSQQYGQAPDWSKRYVYHVDWERVASKHDGIIIAPYCWQKRLDDDTFWYYPWDCASGCIWHPRAVAALTSISG